VRDNLPGCYEDMGDIGCRGNDAHVVKRRRHSRSAPESQYEHARQPMRAMTRKSAYPGSVNISGNIPG